MRSGIHDDPDRFVRWALRGSLVLLGVGGLLFILATAIPLASNIVYALGLFAFIAGLCLWVIIRADRYIRFVRGLPRRNYSLFAPERYVCPKCGYALRGVRGPYCPECGTVRPAPVDDDDLIA